MEAGALLAIAKLAAFGGLVWAWHVARKTAAEGREERAKREAAEAVAQRTAEAEPLRDAA
ncbi:MAG: hypothetical protein AAF416_08435 [Pseudomonadota bacterium]